MWEKEKVAMQEKQIEGDAIPTGTNVHHSHTNKRVVEQQMTLMKKTCLCCECLPLCIHWICSNASCHCFSHYFALLLLFFKFIFPLVRT